MNKVSKKALWVPWFGTVVLAMALGFGLGKVTELTGNSTDKHFVESRDAVEQNGVASLEARPTEEAGGVHSESALDQIKQTMGMSNPKTRDREMENALSHASLDEVMKALDWASALPEGVGKRSLISKIMDRWGQLDGVSAAAYAQKMFAETGNPQLLKDAIRGWGQTDPSASVQYTQSMAVSDGIKKDISRDLFRDWADRSPQAAAAYAAANPVDVGRGGMMGLISDRWSKQDPQAAANWAMSLSPGKDQQRAYDELVQNWSDQNLQAAADFVSRQPAGTNKDVMVSTLAREVAKQDPSAALQWVATLSDADMQSKTALSFMWRSAEQDLATAQQLINASALSSAAKEAVLSKMTNGNGGWRGGGP
jgi:hypothetical protein